MAAAHSAMTFADHIHVAVIGDDVVLLDERDGDYLCLPGAADLIAAIPDRPLAILYETLAAELTSMGMTGTEPRDTPRFAPASRDVAPVEPSAGTMAGWLPLLARSSAKFHQATFAQLLATARSGRRQGSSLDEVERQAGWMVHARPWLPFQGLCLKRSFLQLQLLQAAGCQVDWMFGVRTWPFSAHCWLQAGDLALNDTVDRISVYEPILRVRA